MFVSKVELRDYRNYNNIIVELDSGINILYGENAQGKTNFIEAIYFAAIGRSHRTNYEKELIAFDKKAAGIRIFIEKGSFTDRIDVSVKKEGKKEVAVNGINVKKLAELFGSLYSVIFSPEDLSLVNGSPSARRRFMDMEICQLYPIFYFELGQYCKILKQRNSLLKEISKKRNTYELNEMLNIWDEQIVEHGIKIINYRKEFIKKINEIANVIHKGISEKEELRIDYKNNVESSDYMEKLRKNRERDILMGTTSIGVHKDDISFFLNGIDARMYGSQGQRRCVSLSLKLAEIEMIKSETSKSPVLLLDDVFSELDKGRQRALVNKIGGIQTIITCTGIDVLNPNYFNSNRSIRTYNVEKGTIKRNK